MTDFNLNEAVPFQLGYLLGLSTSKRILDSNDEKVLLTIRKTLSELSGEPLPEDK